MIIMPLRIEYYEDCILDVIVGPSEDKLKPAPSEPISIPSPQSTASSTPSSSLTSSITSPRSLSPISVAPLSIVRPIMGSLSAVPEVANEITETEVVVSSSPTSPVLDESLAVMKNLTLDTKPKEASSNIDGMLLRSESLDTLMTTPLHNTIQTVHTTPSLLPINIVANDELYAEEQEQEQEQEQERVEYSAQEYDMKSQPLMFRSSVYSFDTAYQPRTTFNSGPLSPLPEQRGEAQSHIYQQHYHQAQSQVQSQLQAQQQYQQQYQQQHLQQQHYIQHQQQQQQQQQYQQPQHYHQQQQQHQQYQLQHRPQYNQLPTQQIHYYQPQQQPLPPLPQPQQPPPPPAHQQQLQQYQDSQQYHDQLHQAPLSLSNQDNAPSIPPRPMGTTSSSPRQIHPLKQLSISHAPQTLDPDGRAFQASSPTGSLYSQSYESIPYQLGSSPQSSRFHGSTRNLSEGDTGLEYIHGSYNSQQESETKVKSLETMLHMAQSQALEYKEKNHALTRESFHMTAKIMNRATLIQNRIQTVLTQSHELRDNSTPRLFIILPVLILDQKSPITPTDDQRKFRLHFLCECGQYTRPLPTSGLNHIHFVEHEGYEIVRPVEFFERYGASIRSFSHLIRNGVRCGNVVSIPPLLGFSEQQGQRNRAFSLGQETLMNQILDTRLLETIEYLDSLDALDLDGNQNIPEHFDGTDIRELQTYIKIPPQDLPCLANFYRIITNEGYVKWICEDHYRSTIHHQNELSLQKEITALGGHYDLRTGIARIQLETAAVASQFYRAITRAHNLHELDVGLKWQFTEGDLSKFVQAINDSKVRVLTLDGCRQKTDTNLKLINFGKKYDPLLKIIFGSKIGSLKLVNIPSMMTKISTKPQQLPLIQAFGIKALHLENVGVLDLTGSEKTGHSLGGLSYNNGLTRIQALSFLTNLLTSFQSLSELSVPGMNIRDEGIKLLVEQTPLQRTLRRINFYNNAISPTGGLLLATFMSREKAITHLDLGMNLIGDEVLVQIIDALGPKLTLLNLENTGFRENAASALERMVTTNNKTSDPVPRLEYLNLASNAWTTSSIRSLGKIISCLRIDDAPPSSPSVTSSLDRRGNSALRLEMEAAEVFLVVNSMIRTSQISLSTNRPWYEQPDVLSGHLALTATKESYAHSVMKAQDSISFNSKLKVLRIMDAGLSEGAARYLIGLLDVSVLTKLDLRRCIRLFKPREILTILARIFPNSSYSQEGGSLQQQHVGTPRAPTPYGVSGTPQNNVRFLHLNTTYIDDHVAQMLAQDLESDWTCIERLDIGGNHLTHKGITMILKSLCQNTKLQHLNLGQNFGAISTLYQSSVSVWAQSLRDALLRFMTTNKTLQVLYFISADIDIVAKGLSSNSTIRSLVFDRLEGTQKDVEAFGRALAMNQTLMRFKVYDGRLEPFLQAYYGQGQQTNHQTGHHQTHYVDLFKDFKQDAIKFIEQGITFNESIIEFQWPEMFDVAQPATKQLEALLSRNMVKLKSATNTDSDTVQESNRYSVRGNRITRGLSVLSTSSSFSNGSATSSNSSLTSLNSSQTHIRENSSPRGQTAFLPSVPELSDSYSIHSDNSGGSAGKSIRQSSTWDERRLSTLELSRRTLDQLRNTPSQQTHVQQQIQQQQQQQQQQKQQQQQQQKKPQPKPSIKLESGAHIMLRFQKK
ncbi:hypothetical protein BGZ49_000031 [Haplosporangium sp. Z 27]|nr:hypothetical protein BGZ49_000031 [Haplosporangium sp. Z 27]